MRLFKCNRRSSLSPITVSHKWHLHLPFAKWSLFICRMKYWWLSNISSQITHSNGDDPEWDSRSIDELNPLKQKKHSKGYTLLLWNLCLCFSNESSVANKELQIWHWNSPTLWDFICCMRLLNLGKLLLQKSQLNSYSVCCSKLDLFNLCIGLVRILTLLESESVSFALVLSVLVCFCNSLIASCLWLVDSKWLLNFEKLSL